MKRFLNGLVKVQYVNERYVVSGRELHDKCKVQKDFSDWIKDQLERTDAIEGTEFTTLKGKTSEVGGRPTLEYYLTKVLI